MPEGSYDMTDTSHENTMKERALKIEMLNQYNALTGQRTLHPLVSVVVPGEAKPFKSLPVSGNFYALFFKQVECGNFRYGRRCHDFQSGTLVFKAPGTLVDIDTQPGQPGISGILFHPDLLNNTLLACKKAEYTFFSYRENESLHLSEQEKQIVQECMGNIQKELQRDIDRFSLRLTTIYLELLLDYCLRFYERQFITRTDINSNTLKLLDRFLEEYFQSEQRHKTESQSIEYIHEKMPQSPAYLNDLVRIESGKALREYVCLKRIDIAKYFLLKSGKTLSDIAIGLGFRDTPSFFYLFRKMVGCTPEEYRRKC